MAAAEASTGGARERLLSLRPASVDAKAHAALSELAQVADPFDRRLPLHLTASGLVLDLGGGRLLLRYHPRFGTWMQLGGHGDPGEVDPLVVARRECAEESGLGDLLPLPEAALVQAVVVEVPASAAEGAHRHLDLRYLFSTLSPGAATAESPEAPLRWVTTVEAESLVAEENLQPLLRAAGLALRRARRAGAGTR